MGQALLPLLWPGPQFHWEEASLPSPDGPGCLDVEFKRRDWEFPSVLERVRR